MFDQQTGEEHAAGQDGNSSGQHSSSPGLASISQRPAPTIDDVPLPPQRDTSTTDVEFGYDDEDGFGSQAVEAIESKETPCSFITGVAGSGKSFTVKQRLLDDPGYAVLASTTGISAVNLNATTIHSLLGFFDLDSLKDAYLSGSAQRKLRQIREDGFKNVVLDEISMFSCDMLDVLYRVFEDVNQNLPRGEEPIGLVLTGDWCQLPPIAERKHTGRGAKPPTPWAFDAKCWPKFEQNTTRLTKVWRQTDPQFLAALNYARSGNGPQTAGIFKAAGVEFNAMVDSEFDGTTLVGKNEEVDRFNQLALDRVKGRLIGLPTRRWGKQRSEWKNIPERQIVIRENAYVMLLANKYNEYRELEYANGDCGHVKGIVLSEDRTQPPAVVVELVRNGREVLVSYIVRNVESKEKLPGEGETDTIPAKDDDGSYHEKPHYRAAAKKFVSGQIQYYPIRLAWASTIHKSQGLSLDRCQIDFKSWMLGMPAMAYVALSRCRTMQGLRIVGIPEAVANKCKIDERVRRWL